MKYAAITAAVLVLLLIAMLCVSVARGDTLTLFTNSISADPSSPPTSIGIGVAVCVAGCYTLNGQPKFVDNIVFGQVTADSQAHTFTANQQQFQTLIANICPNDCPYFYAAPSLFPYFSFTANGVTEYGGFGTYGWGTESWLSTGTVDAFNVSVDAIGAIRGNANFPMLWEAFTPAGNQATINYSIEGQGLVATPEPSSLWLCGFGLVLLFVARQLHG